MKKGIFPIYSSSVFVVHVAACPLRRGGVNTYCGTETFDLGEERNISQYTVHRSLLCMLRPVPCEGGGVNTYCGTETFDLGEEGNISQYTVHRSLLCMLRPVPCEGVA